MNKEKIIEEIDEISAFKYNWDGYGAEPFTFNIIKKAKAIVKCLNDKYPNPDIVPSCCGIQLEWDYMENALEVYAEEGGVSYLKVVGPDMEDWTETEISDLWEINDLLSWLYERG